MGWNNSHKISFEGLLVGSINVKNIRKTEIYVTINESEIILEMFK